MLAVPARCAIEVVSTFTSFAHSFFMNRTQYWLLVTLSCLVVIFLAAQAGFSVWSVKVQSRLITAQQVIQQGRACDQRWRQLIGRIVEVGQKSQDQALKDLLTRQGITVRVNPDSSSSSSQSSAPAPAAAPAPTPSNP
jgi:hypothetical protein